MFKKILVFLLCLGILASGIVLMVDALKHSPEVGYKGEIVFEKEAEYQDFKYYLLEPEVKLKTVSVLASEPPIWIRYSIITPREWTFPYDYEEFYPEIGAGLSIGLSLMIAFGGGAAVGVGIWTFSKEEK